MKLVLILFGLFIAYRFLSNRTTFFGQVLGEGSGIIIGFLARVLRAFMYGWIAYALILIYGNFNRISTWSDVSTLLAARPSEGGGPGIFGVLLGIVFALRAFCVPAVPAGQVQGPTFQTQVGTRSVSASLVRLIRWTRR